MYKLGAQLRVKPFLLEGQQECGRYPILDRNVPVYSAGAMPWVHSPAGIACCGSGAVQEDFGSAKACSQQCSQELGCSLALQLGELWLGEEGVWMFSLQLQLRKGR